jgi:hypothetical protein
MKKIITVFGALLLTCLIITSCGSEKNDTKKTTKNTTTKKSQIEIDAEKSAAQLCEMMEIDQSMTNLEDKAKEMIESGDADGWDDPKILKMEEEYRTLEDKLNNSESMVEEMIFDRKFENMENAENYISYFKNSAEKCRDEIEDYTGWDDMIGEIEYTILMQFDTQDAWNETEQNEFLEACMAENDADFMSEYCACGLDIVMSMYDSPEEADELMTEDDVMEIAESCSHTFDM